MELSDKAIKDLKGELIKVYGSDFDLSDNDLDTIGMFLLSSLAECLKYKNMVK